MKHGTIISSLLSLGNFHPRKINWYLTKPHDGVLLGDFGTTSAFSTTAGKHITSLVPGLLKKEYLIGETPRTMNSFLNCFAIVHGDFSCQDFQLLG